MTRYLINGKVVMADNPDFGKQLAEVYGSKNRPLCLCKSPGVEVYIAKLAEKTYIIKRMPNSGGSHSPECESYEPPQELSGAGQVMGAAIQEDSAEGVTTIKLNFSLSKSPSKPVINSGGEKDSVKTDGSKLTLRGALHYLWEEAGFNRWSPSMAGKRNWYIVRKFLQQAAEGKTTKRMNLNEVLYIPESFSPDHKDDIIRRRNHHLLKLTNSQTATKPLMLMIGEVKEVGQARYGYKMVVKHLPDYPFMMNEDIFKRFSKRFDTELEMWSISDSIHLVAIATFGVGRTGVASIEEISVMTVSDNWIPFETVVEKQLLDTLIHQKRRFIKGLRYNLSSSSPLAFAVLTDTPNATALYIVDPEVSDSYLEEMAELRDGSKLDSWIWNVLDDMPELPEKMEQIPQFS